MRLLHALALVGLLLAGGALVWPWAVGYLTHERSPGRILDVIPEPLANGRVRLRIAYEFPVGAGVDGSRYLLGWGVADAYFRHLGHPDVAAVRAEGVIRDLMDTDRGQVRVRTVFYRAEDPAGTAVILDETAERPTRRIPIGLVLLGVAVVWSLSLWRRRS